MIFIFSTKTHAINKYKRNISEKKYKRNIAKFFNKFPIPS